MKSIDELVKNVYVPYIEKHRDEFGAEELTAYEQASRKLADFLNQNEASRTFNEMQRIVLVASEFDEQTLSAVAWLNSNQVDISCFQLCLYKMNGETVLDVKKILPVPVYSDFYVNVVNRADLADNAGGQRNIARRRLPKIDALLSWGVVKSGDIIVAKGTGCEAELCQDGRVRFEGKTLSLQQWLKGIYNWASVETYAFSVHKSSNKTLSELRSEYMEKMEMES